MVWHNPRATMPEEAKTVSVTQGETAGYWGQVPDLAENEVYTVSGVHDAAEKEKRAQAERDALFAKADRQEQSGSDDADKTSSRRTSVRKS